MTDTRPMRVRAGSAQPAVASPAVAAAATAPVAGTCSSAITFTGSGTLRLPARVGGKLRIVVVSTRRR